MRPPCLDFASAAMADFALSAVSSSEPSLFLSLPDVDAASASRRFLAMGPSPPTDFSRPPVSLTKSPARLVSPLPRSHCLPSRCLRHLASIEPLNLGSKIVATPRTPRAQNVLKRPTLWDTCACMVDLSNTISRWALDVFDICAGGSDCYRPPNMADISSQTAGQARTTMSELALGGTSHPAEEGLICMRIMSRFEVVFEDVLSPLGRFSCVRTARRRMNRPSHRLRSISIPSLPPGERATTQTSSMLTGWKFQRAAWLTDCLPAGYPAELGTRSGVRTACISIRCRARILGLDSSSLAAERLFEMCEYGIDRHSPCLSRLTAKSSNGMSHVVTAMTMLKQMLVLRAVAMMRVGWGIWAGCPADQPHSSGLSGRVETSDCFPDSPRAPVSAYVEIDCLPGYLLDQAEADALHFESRDMAAPRAIRQTHRHLRRLEDAATASLRL
ncbi:hypothetical protein V8D89_011224 [Ganoderma adspersum]